VRDFPEKQRRNEMQAVAVDRLPSFYSKNSKNGVDKVLMAV
jgi:hypothetical protein